MRRLRTFTMPDCHALCKDISQAKDEMQRRFELARTVVEGSGLSISDDMEFAIRIVKDFYEENKDFVHALIRKWGKPAFVEIWDKKFFYFIFKYEWNFVDALNKAATLTTDQIDVENAERYDIRFIDSDNKKKFPVILHLSPSGAIERIIYGLLEKAYMQQQAGKNPVLPLWLSPTQVMLCPVNDSFIPFAENISEQLEKENIRVDVDDRTESIGKKIRDAEMEWIPMVVVLGEKERESGQLPVRFRETGKVENMTIKDLVKSIGDKTKRFPYKQLSLPKLLTKRPIFN